MLLRKPEQADLVVVGAGVVGTATGVGLLAKGYRVVFCDCSEHRIAALRAEGLEAVNEDRIAELDASAYLISVPTPTTKGRVDLSCVVSAAETVGRAISKHPKRPLVVLRSTVPPGTTEHVVIPALESSSGRAAGEGFGVCVNPEFLRQATAVDDFCNPRVIVIGALDDASDRRLRNIYAPWRRVSIVSTTLCTAEAIKYTANLFNATKITFFNEMKRVLHRLGADPHVAFAAVANGAEGMWNPLYGIRALGPFGGACLPKDTAAFLNHVEQLGLADLMPLLQATIQLNEELIAVQRASALEVRSAAAPISATHPEYVEVGAAASAVD